MKNLADNFKLVYNKDDTAVFTNEDNTKVVIPKGKGSFTNYLKESYTEQQASLIINLLGKGK